jgi:hypothetical protein
MQALALLSRSRAKDEDMRDFRNAKVMSQTLRSALAAKGIKITVGQSLELVAAMFGLADWNTLAAAINAEKPVPREKVSPLSDMRSNPFPPLSAELATTLHRAIGFAAQRNHEYATLEHLLLALIEDADASASISACNADPIGLTERLVDYLDHGLTKLVMERHAEPKPTAAFQRVVQRAELRRKASGRSTVITGADMLEEISYYETQSPAARFLAEQGITYQQLLYSRGTGRR